MRYSELRETVNVNVVRKCLLYVRSIRRIMRKYQGVYVRRQRRKRARNSRASIYVVSSRFIHVFPMKRRQRYISALCCKHDTMNMRDSARSTCKSYCSSEVCLEKAVVRQREKKKERKSKTIVKKKVPLSA